MPSEVAAALEISTQKVRDLTEEGLFMALSIGGEPRERDHVRVQRFSVVAYLLNLAEDKGMPVPVKEPPLVTWWRGELRKRPKGKAAAGKIRNN